MTQLDPIEPFIQRLKEGDPQAAAEVFQRYSDRLIRLTHKRFDARMRQKLDAEDVLQSVFRSFFRLESDGRFEIRDWGSLWSLLVRITLHKCGKKIEFYQAAKRSLDREASPNLADDESCNGWVALAREPTPDEALALKDTIEEFSRPLTVLEKEVFELSLQGRSVAEISQQVDRTERHIRRILAQIKQRLLDLDDTA